MSGPRSATPLCLQQMPVHLHPIDDPNHPLMRHARVERDGADEMRDYLQRLSKGGEIEFLECTPEEAAAAFRHCYAMGGATVRFRAVHAGEVKDLAALDVAFPRNGLPTREDHRIS